MTEKPILFSGAMVRAILEDRKTQTRQVMMPQPSIRPARIEWYGPWDTKWMDLPKKHRHREIWVPTSNSGKIGIFRPQYYVCPYEVGDHLWVRETWRTHKGYDLYAPRNLPEGLQLQFADGHISVSRSSFTYSKPVWGKWRPSIFMPKWAARIWLEVTRVRCERVQEISTEDCIAEGIDDDWIDGHKASAEQLWSRFHCLWDSISAKRGYAWDENPWVWVYEFKRVDR